MFKGRTPEKKVVLKINEEWRDKVKAVVGGSGGERYEIPELDVCEFDNDRKRMSVVVKYPNGKIMLLLKGADTSVKPFLKESVVSALDDKLDHFAKKGLRTLVMAQRELNSSEYERWHREYVE